MGIQLNSYGSSRKVAKWILIGVIAGSAYFANKSIQSRFGDQALAAIEFEIKDLPEALRDASSEDKLVIASLSARFCPTCRKLDQEVFADQAIKQQIEKDFVFARIDYESETGEAFMHKYRVSGFPILLILNAQGQRLTRLPLTFSAQEFALNLDKVNQHYAPGLNPDAKNQPPSLGR